MQYIIQHAERPKFDELFALANIEPADLNEEATKANRLALSLMELTDHYLDDHGRYVGSAEESDEEKVQKSFAILDVRSEAMQLRLLAQRTFAELRLAGLTEQALVYTRELSQKYDDLRSAAWAFFDLESHDLALQLETVM